MKKLQYDFSETVNILFNMSEIQCLARDALPNRALTPDGGHDEPRMKLHEISCREGRSSLEAA